MNLLYDILKKVPLDDRTISMIGKIAVYITPFLIINKQIYSSLCSLFPSYIERIVHFDTENLKLDTVYIGKQNLYSIKKAFVNLIDLADNGTYMFHVWNKNTLKYEYYILTADMVRNALKLHNVSYMWAMHDSGIVELLSNFVEYSLIDSTFTITGITVNGVDETKTLKPFMQSIHIPNNITPFVLYMLLQYLKSDRLFYIEAKNTLCTYCDDELNEIILENPKDYIISTNKDMICPLCKNVTSFDIIESENSHKNNIQDDDIEDDVIQDDDIEEIFELDGITNERKKDKDI